MKTLLLVVLLLILPPAGAQTVAVTIDDGPFVHDTPLMNAQQRNDALLKALAKHNVKAGLFVTVNNGTNTSAGMAFTQAWSKAGHMISNHTMSHPSLHAPQVTLEQFQQEVAQADAVLAPIKGFEKWFRFPYLREGNTPEKRDGMRSFLKAQGYRNAHVSLDTSDWSLNNLLVYTLERDPKANIEPIKQAYLAHVWQRAQAYQALSQRLQGRDIAQVLLIHHNLINALWLDDVIALFKANGWRVITPQQAFKDPIYLLEPDRQVAGQSLLFSMARTLGLWSREGYQFEGAMRLMDDGDYEINQLKTLGFEERPNKTQ